MARTNMPKWPKMCNKLKRDGGRCKLRATPGGVMCRIHGGARYADLRRKRYLVWALSGNYELAMEGTAKSLQATLAGMIMAMITENETGLSAEQVLSAAAELLALTLD